MKHEQLRILKRFPGTLAEFFVLRLWKTTNKSSDRTVKNKYIMLKHPAQPTCKVTYICCVTNHDAPALITERQSDIITSDCFVSLRVPSLHMYQRWLSTINITGVLKQWHQYQNIALESNNHLNFSSQQQIPSAYFLQDYPHIFFTRAFMLSSFYH
jgi:hypothetical protein